MGNRNAFRVLMSRYGYFVSRIIFKVLWNNEDTADAVQDTFIKVWKNIHSYNGSSKFSTWLYKIAVNSAYDKLRSNQCRGKLFVDYENIPDLQNIFKSDNDFTDSISDRQLISVIVSLADKLSPVQKTVFTLMDLEKLNTKETSQILEMSESAVKTNLCYARKNIRKKLVNYLRLDKNHEV